MRLYVNADSIPQSLPQFLATTTEGFHLIIGLSGRINTSMIRKSALRDVIQSLLIGNPQTTPLRQSTLVANAGVLLTYEEFYLFTRLNCSDMR